MLTWQHIFDPSIVAMLYKVISMILVGRMAHVLQDVISPAKNAFLKGRNMVDNINLI